MRNPSCWLPMVRLTMRASALPGVSAFPAAWLRSTSTREKSERNVARLRSIHSRRSMTAGVSSASGSGRPTSAWIDGSIADSAAW